MYWYIYVGACTYWMATLLQVIVYVWVLRHGNVVFMEIWFSIVYSVVRWMKNLVIDAESVIGLSLYDLPICFFFPIIVVYELSKAEYACTYENNERKKKSGLARTDSGTIIRYWKIIRLYTRANEWKTCLTQMKPARALKSPNQRTKRRIIIPLAVATDETKSPVSSPEIL